MTKTTNIFSDEVETAFSCPQPGDPDHFTNCCGPSWQRKCCAPPTKFNHGPIGGGSVISFFGIVTGVVILVVCLVLICCCCTPCCLLAKQRRRRGLVTSLLLFVSYRCSPSVKIFNPQVLRPPPPSFAGLVPSMPPTTQPLYHQAGPPPPGYPSQPPPYPGPPQDGHLPPLPEYQAKPPPYNVHAM